MDAIPAPVPGLPPAPAAGAAGKPDPTAAKIKDAAREFEAIFIQQMLQTARQATVPGGRSGQNLYQDLMDEHVARALAKGGGIGLADALARDLTRQLAGPKKSSSPAPGGPIQAGEGRTS